MNKSENENQFGPYWGILIFPVGAIIIFLSIRYFHKQWSAGELIYDIGVAVIIVALVDLLLLPVLRDVASRKTALGKILEELRQRDIESQKRMEEFDQRMRDLKLDILSTNVDSLGKKLDVIEEQYLKNIRLNVDPEFARAMQVVREYEKRSGEKNA